MHYYNSKNIQLSSSLLHLSFDYYHANQITIPTALFLKGTLVVQHTYNTWIGVP
jgi:hypothetical protein